MGLPQNIRAARIYAGISKQTLADRIGPSYDTIKNYEAGATTPKPPAVAAIARATHVPLWFIQEGFEPLNVWDSATARTMLEAGLEDRAARRLPRDDEGGGEEHARTGEDP